MSFSPLSIKRSNVLGDIYKQCDAIESIPVYMNDESGELLGYADESMGHYADTFLFHLSESVCKQLSSTNSYDFALDFEYSDKATTIVNQRRIKLNYIALVEKKSLSLKRNILAS